jgi:tetratricopeptide (TPR) repeat protein
VRLVPPETDREIGPTFAIVAALELSRRGQPNDRWVDAAWRDLSPLLTETSWIRPGPAGTIVVAAPFERPDALSRLARQALELRESFAGHSADDTELRGGIALGVIDRHARSDAVERCAERLALAAAPGQWLLVEDAARLLQSGFELRGVGIMPRWRLPFPVAGRALIAPLVAPVLSSAVTGDPPTLVLGRADERRRLIAELSTVGHRRVLLVTAPAGGGKSHLLRRVLADAHVEAAAGIAFPPLGAHKLEPLRALAARFGVDGDGTEPAEALGARLGGALSARAFVTPAVVVVDDIHWADPASLVALRAAIATTDEDAPAAWVLSTRTASMAHLSDLVALADAQIALPPLDPPDRVALLEQRLGTVPEAIQAHVMIGRERGNPLYLEHLAAGLTEADAMEGPPGNLHEAVLARLDRLVDRARALTHWAQRSASPRTDLEALEREVGDWLDRLETSDLAELATIGRYLGRLGRADAEIVIARSLLAMPVASNRRLALAIERLAAASTDALMDYLGELVRDGHSQHAVGEALAMAERAERALRLSDAERLLVFACEHDAGKPELVRKCGDLALALGRPDKALQSYWAVDADADLERRIARAQAAAGQAGEAIRRLDRAARRHQADPSAAYALALDGARLRGASPPPGIRPCSAADRRRAARVAGWADVSDAQTVREAARLLVLDGSPAACAVELIETAALARLAGIDVSGLALAADRAVAALGNPRARSLLDTADIGVGRRTFLHWDA